tara:strand:+ start:671 stop:994 length:324 start_codon:yes stop_codon:yes gene_type:complete
MIYENIMSFLEADADEDLPKMIHFSMEIDRDIKTLLKEVKNGAKFKVPMIENIIDLLESIIDYTPAYRDTPIGHIEEYGRNKCREHILQLKSMCANRTHEGGASSTG